MTIILTNSYADFVKPYTIENIINRWAPNTENKTDSYIEAVCRLTGYARDEVFNPLSRSAITKVVKAIITVENGCQPYTEQQITAGIDLASESWEN